MHTENADQKFFFTMSFEDAEVKEKSFLIGKLYTFANAKITF